MVEGERIGSSPIGGGLDHTGSEPLMRDPSQPPRVPSQLQGFDGALGRNIIDLHVWAVRQGLSGLPSEALFDGFCQRLVDAGVPLWRAFAGMRTLHPQWGGYTYTWRRDQRDRAGAIRTR